MRWCVICHPELGAAVVAEDSLTVHEPRGWVRTSPLVDDQYTLNPADHPLPEPAPTEPSGDVTESTPAVDALSRPATKTRKSTED